MRALITISIILAVIIFGYFSQKDDKDSYLVKGLGQIKQLFDKGINSNQTTTIYKIKDKDGNWTYTNKPPENDAAQEADKKLETLEINPNANVIPSIVEPAKEKNK